MQRVVRIAGAADTVVVVSAISAGLALRNLPHETIRYSDTTFVLTAIAILIIWLASLKLNGAYRWDSINTGLTDATIVIKASAYTFGLISAFSYLFKTEISRSFVLIAFPIGTFLLWLEKRILKRFMARPYLQEKFAKPVLIVSPTRGSSDITSQLQQVPEFQYAQIHTANLSEEFIELGNVTERLVSHAQEINARKIVLDLGLNLSNRQIAELSWACDHNRIELLVVPEFIGYFSSRLHINQHGSLPLVQLAEPRLSALHQSQKRMLDLALAIPAFILLQPVYLVISLLVALTSPGPILFTQPRIGAEGKAFPFYKFRTMRDGADKERLDVLGRPDEEMADRYKRDPRITPIGRVLRRFSLDELPQLWNVIRGDMSLVGPRPMLQEEAVQLEENHQRRHLIKPGLTGLWQISGRKETSWEERMLLDLYYIDQWSISTDLAIVLKTFKVIVDGKGSW